MSPCSLKSIWGEMGTLFPNQLKSIPSTQEVFGVHCPDHMPRWLLPENGLPSHRSHGAGSPGISNPDCRGTPRFRLTNRPLVKFTQKQRPPTRARSGIRIKTENVKGVPNPSPYHNPLLSKLALPQSKACATANRSFCSLQKEIELSSKAVNHDTLVFKENQEVVFCFDDLGREV